MTFFTETSIRTRLSALAALVVLALLIVGATGVGSLLSLSRQFSDFRAVEFSQQAELVRLRQHLGDIRRYEKDVLLNIDDLDGSKAYQVKWKRAVSSARDSLQALGQKGAEAQSTAILALMQQYEGAAGEVIQRTINGQIVTSTEANQTIAPAKEFMRKADPLVEELATQLQEAAETRAVAVASRAENELILIGVIGLLSLLIFIPATWLTVLSISRPLGRAVAVADQVAEGNLAHTISVSGGGEVAALMSSLARMQSSLREVVSSVKQSGDAILSASSEVANGSADLSARTERAAAELQRTASTMHELADIVAESRAASQEVSQLGARSLASTRRGGDIVQEVVSNMGQIATDSREISQMIGLIDSVAFQTNLLALNAAVEAARAGEQGRGFAVVAAEVRQLAQRSAEAAKQISQVIRASSDQVNQGSQLVKAAQTEMSEVLGVADRVAAMMDHLNDRSGEQARDIAEVARAIGELDAWTQENAALVEESSAAAESLRQQALSLNQVIGRFRLAA
ncbi:MAG: HAMP domain-containing protein [Proteobacteria bacterium]|uniref:methyl-accepting chemotaxis protein n=1 Tax=Aquabacterium sp. TaxID=1872578 RepID=UPI0035C76A57|nr:HAMP domain-containing protein [Pseudomonadota bacterium]